MTNVQRTLTELTEDRSHRKHGTSERHASRSRNFGGAVWSRRLAAKLSAMACLTLACLISDAIAGAQQVLAPHPQPATIAGTVEDVNGGVIPGATVVLNGSTPDERHSVSTGDNGFFQLLNIRPDVDYRVTVSAPDFADWTSDAFALMPGQYYLLTGARLRLAVVQVTVVALTSEQIATQQVKIEETQRVLGIVPNFYVVYDPRPAPLTAKLKFQLAARALTDPISLAGFTINAGIYQLADYPDYHSNAEGFGQRLGSTFAGAYTNVLVGDALLPSLLHQDPRFHYQGAGTTRSRVLHALSNPFIICGDNGQREFNYSGVGGDLASGAIANAYYPSRNRGSYLVVHSALIGIGGRMANGLVQEFVLNRAALRHGRKAD